MESDSLNNGKLKSACEDYEGDQRIFSTAPTINGYLGPRLQLTWNTTLRRYTLMQDVQARMMSRL